MVTGAVPWSISILLLMVLLLEVRKAPFYRSSKPLPRLDPDSMSRVDCSTVMPLELELPEASVTVSPPLMIWGVARAATVQAIRE